MRLKLGVHVHNVVRRSATEFEVDGVRVNVGGGSNAGPRRARAFAVRNGDQVFAQIGGRSYRMSVVSRAAADGADHATAEGELEAPMPGRVTRVAVAVGDAVKRGQELIVVEAMKMENALVAPSDGVVKSLDAKVGDMVAPGPALIVIEAGS
jgi:3-methylcrotonyl-CoA carboxylase alpha subunit